MVTLLFQYNFLDGARVMRAGGDGAVREREFEAADRVGEDWHA